MGAFNSATSNGLVAAVAFPLQSGTTSVSMFCGWAIGAASALMTIGGEQVNFEVSESGGCASLSLPSESASKPFGWMSFRPLWLLLIHSSCGIGIFY